MQQVTGKLKEFGAGICAITPQPPDASRPLIEKHKIGFDLLSDHRNEYASKLGLRFKLPDDLKQVYLSFGNDLAVRNGEDSWTLPMPGRFVIDTRGIVRVVDVDPDYRYRRNALGGVPERPQARSSSNCLLRGYGPVIRRGFRMPVQADDALGTESLQTLPWRRQSRANPSLESRFPGYWEKYRETHSNSDAHP